MTKTSQDNNLNYIHFLKHFYEYHTEKLKYRDVTCLILKVLLWWICYYCFCSHIQSLAELESLIVATAPDFELTAPLTYSLWFCIWSSYFCKFNAPCELHSTHTCTQNLSNKVLWWTLFLKQKQWFGVLWASWVVYS